MMYGCRSIAAFSHSALGVAAERRREEHVCELKQRVSAKQIDPYRDISGEEAIEHITKGR